jgi:type I restriction enzyme M protein
VSESQESAAGYNRLDSSLTEHVAALAAVEADLRLTLGANAARAVVAGITILAAQGDDWLARHQVLAGIELVQSMRFDKTFGTVEIFPGFDAGLREISTNNISDVARIINILGTIQPADRLAIAELMVRRAAAPSSGVFTVPPAMTELAARLALELSPISHSTAMPTEKVAFDPRLGCGEMLLDIVRRARLHPLVLRAAGYEPSAEALNIARAAFSLSGISVDDLKLAEWLEEPADSNRKVDYLVSAIPATPWRHLDYRLDYTIPISARPRSSDSSLLYLAKISRLIAMTPQAIAAVAVNSAALTTGAAASGEAELRRFVVESGTLHAVIVLPSGILDRTSVAPTILVLRHPPSASRSSTFRLVDARGLGRQDDRRQPILSPEDVERIITAVSGSGNELASDVSASTLGDDQRWRIPSKIRVEPSNGRTSSSAVGGLNEDLLEELCEILPGRNRTVRRAGVDTDTRVVRAADIGEDLVAWSDLEASNATKSSSVDVLPGDIIGSISPPYGRWALVPNEYGPALASDHTIVLRKRGETSMRYLLGYLRSDRAKRYLEEMFRGTIPRLDRIQLAKLPVPKCPLSVDYLDKVISGYDSELVRLEGEVSKLRSRLNEIYRGESPVEIAADVDALHGVTASLRSIENLNDALRIARASFPYPISRTLRAVDRTRSARARYHEVVHEGLETISTVLTVLAASVAHERGISGPAIKSWTNQVRHNGATIGIQRSMFTEVARAILSEDIEMSDVGGLGQALGDEASPAVSFFAVLLDERNRIHGDYPRTEYEFEQRLAHSEEAMHSLLDSLSFLARWELLYAEFIEPIPGMVDEYEPEYSGQFAVLRGDNPDWSMAEQVSVEPLYRGRVYAQVDQDQLIDVHPYLLVLDCRQCGSKEVYYPDSFDSSVARLKSIDRGHPQNCTDERLLRTLQKAFTSFGP